jgi:hypothetical protein
MDVVAFLTGLLLVLLILVDGFETMVLPRRVAHTFRFTRFYFSCTWPLWRFLGRQLPLSRRRHSFFSIFGPLSMLGLFSTWVAGLILGFALMHWSFGETLQTAGEQADFFTYLYLSGVTFFTLGYGDITPRGSLGRALAVAEAGGGFGFLAVIIGYLPVLYQAFSGREVTISLLDARAGSPPSAAQLLLRAARAGNMPAIQSFLIEWERWSAELLESHLSFAILCFYRSQHDNQSWLATLTFILDTCTILLCGVKGPQTYQAQLTFAMARHAAVDLALVFRRRPRIPHPERLPDNHWQRLRTELEKAGLGLLPESQVADRLAELRVLYEPFVNSLANYFALTLPPVYVETPPVDNWQTSRWTPRTPGIGKLPPLNADDHPF